MVVLFLKKNQNKSDIRFAFENYISANLSQNRHFNRDLWKLCNLHFANFCFATSDISWRMLWQNHHLRLMLQDEMFSRRLKISSFIVSARARKIKIYFPAYKKFQSDENIFEFNFIYWILIRQKRSKILHLLERFVL